MKVLNLYSGIGGNRKLWPKDVQVTAVEYDKKIAEIYSEFFPKDEVIICDAHEYLLKNFEKFDFIWSSPPCPTHSDIRRMGAMAGQYDYVYPDMSLYQEIIFLQTFFKGKWVVENVKPYYKPLIPAQERDRHLFWANFIIPEFEKETAKHHKTIREQEKIAGFDLSKYSGVDKRKALRNCVMPKVGLEILQACIRQEKTLFDL